MRLECYSLTVSFESFEPTHLIMLHDNVLKFHMLCHGCYTMHPIRSEFNGISKESSLISKLTVLGCSKTLRHQCQWNSERMDPAVKSLRSTW